jgi:LPS-assembly lipoprotein
MKLHDYLLLAFLLLTTSCGFHLRGSESGTAIDISSITVSDASAVGVGNEVKALLQAYGTTIAASTSEAEFGLQLTEQLLSKTVLSVSPIDGKVEEYQLTLTVRMTVTDTNQTSLLSGQQIRVARDYAFDDEAVLGSVSEQRILEQEMIRQAASQIVRRLAALSR